MTNQEKIDKLNNLEAIRARIGSCFGSDDKLFAGHQCDEDRAKELRKLSFDNGITLDEIQDIVIGYLYRKGFPADHVYEQTIKATNFFSAKLKHYKP